MLQEAFMGGMENLIARPSPEHLQEEVSSDPNRIQIQKRHDGIESLGVQVWCLGSKLQMLASP